VRKLNKLGTIPMRLTLLTVAALSLATAAFGICGIAQANCADGETDYDYICCGPGLTGIASCFCDWSAAQGYNNCQTVDDCYDLAD
jgi:hypothetical protein